MSRYYGPNWTSQRAKRRSIDGNECVSCGASPGDDTNDRAPDVVRLHVHHRLPVAVFEEHFDDVPFEVMNHERNLVTMCETCHRVIESQEGYAKSAGVKLTGATRDRYHDMKPIQMSDNEFIGRLLDRVNVNQNVTFGHSKREVYDEIKHDLREMVRSEIEQFGRKYLK